MHMADAGDYDKAVSVLEEGYAQTGRESLREEKEQIEYKQTYMEQLYERMAEGDYDGARELCLYGTREFFEDGEKKIIYIPEAGDSLTRIGIGIYDGAYYARVRATYLYYGDYVDGRRDGDGVYIVFFEWGDTEITVGKWIDDLPNGKEERYIDDGMVTWTLKGTMVDGLWNGWVEQQVNYEDRVYDLSFSANYGIVEDRIEEFLDVCEGYIDRESERESILSAPNNSVTYTVVAYDVIKEGDRFLNYLLQRIPQNETMGIYTRCYYCWASRSRARE